MHDEKEIHDFVCEEWKNVDELSLYIHIPFCKARCKFCEYVVLENPDESVENEYVELLLKEMAMYGGDIHKFVPEEIIDRVYEKYGIKQ